MKKGKGIKMGAVIRQEILNSDFIAIADSNGNKITYKELTKKAENFAEYMEKRSLVFFLCDHHTETVELLYEILYLNRVLLLISADIQWELLENLIMCYKPQYIYCTKTYEASYRYHYKMELDRHVLLETGEKRYPIHPDIALLLSTSGTTGNPKLVKLSYDNLYNNAEDICLCLNIQNGQKGISPLSMSYVYGLTFCIWHWHCGATLLITEEPILSDKFRAFYKREKANNFAGIPYTYQILKKINFWESESLKYLHRAMCAGTQMSNSDQAAMISLMKDKFWILYGQTECTGVVSGMNFDENNIKFGSVGKALKNTKAMIDGRTEELLLQGPSVCMGYANYIEQLEEGDKNQRILHTGDVAYIDKEGCIYLKGRLTRYVKVLGKRLNFDDIENYLGDKFSDAEFACTGKDDDISVFYRTENGIMDKEIKNLLDRNMKIPKKFISCFWLKELPRNEVGKIRYMELENLKYEGKDTGNV